MKIIQSFAQFDEGSPYVLKRGKEDYIYLSFYCFLLSCISVTKTYGEFTMFCNKKAHNSMLQYIPYPAFEIMENVNEFPMWSKYKLDAMRTIGDDLIHLDPDVSLFKPVLDPFINGECDVMIQDIVPFKWNIGKEFVFSSINFFKETKILTKPYDGRAMSCGTFGMNKHAQEYYFAGVDILYDAMVKYGVENIDYRGLILEEQLLYLVSIENDFKIHEIVPHELIRKDIFELGLTHGYLHVWTQFKFARKVIDLIRKEIFFGYPYYYETILKYEHDVLSKFKFFQGMNFPKIYDL